MTSKRKLSWAIGFVILLIAVLIVSIITIVFAATQQTVSSQISVTYISKEIRGTVSASWQLGETGGWEEMDTNGAEAGGETLIEFKKEALESAQLLPQQETITLAATSDLDDFIVLKYTFTDSGQDAYSIDLNFTSQKLKNINTFYTTSETEIESDFKTSISTKFESSISTAIMPTKTLNIYILAVIANPDNDADFSGSFSFYLENQKSYQGVSASNADLGEVSAVKSGQTIKITATPKPTATVVGVKNNSTGKWEDVNISTSQTELEVKASSGEYTVVFNDNTHQTTSTVDKIEYTLLQDAQAAIANGVSAISLTEYLKSPKLWPTGYGDNSIVIKDEVETYPVIAVGEGLTVEPNQVLVLPESVLSIPENMFNLSADGLIAISANDAILNKIDAPLKITFNNELDLTHYSQNLRNPSYYVDAELYFDYKINLSTASNANCLNIEYTGTLKADNYTGSGGATENYVKTEKFLIIGNNVNDVYNIKLTNDVDLWATGGVPGESGGGKGFTQMTESESIKVDNTVLYQTEGGSKSFYTDINPDISRSFDNAISNGQTLDISFWYNYSTDSNPCFVTGSLITLANGKVKPVEDITYDDLLLVWDFNTGSYGASYPVWITKTLTTQKYYEITFDDGSVFRSVVVHRLYSTDTNYFEKSVDAARSQVGHKFFGVNTDADGNAILDADGNITFKEKTMVKIEIKKEEVEYYNLITGYSMNVFVNSILSSTGMSNLYGRTPNMKYDEELVAARQADVYDLSELDVPAHYYYGLRLGEQKTVREIPDINQYIKNDMDVAREVEQIEENGVSYNYWIVSTSDDDVFSPDFVPTKVREGGTYTLAQPKNTQNFVGWYCSADGKIYHAGDSVTIRMGSYFTAIYN